jgi:hypothetical protein
MPKLIFRVIIFCVIISGCVVHQDAYTKKDIVKIIDFELSPDESNIAFSAITLIGNLDIWVIGIDGKNLKKLTFQDRSLTNHIAKYFKNKRWRNYFEINMVSPKWTTNGRILFCQRLSKTDMWSTRTVNCIFWTIDPVGTNKRSRTDKDKVVEKETPSLIHTFKISDLSDKYKKKIFLKYDTLWYLNYGETTPKKLIQ